MKKNAFTLIEVVISITIFSIVMVFLYQSLNISKNFNKIFSKHVDTYIDKFHLQKIIYEDFLELKDKVDIQMDKNKNTILKLINSNNTFHNPFNKYITYIVSSKKNLIRIESDVEFKKNSSNTNFYEDENTYIDILAKNIQKFLVVQNKKDTNGYSIYIKTKKDKDYIFSVKTFIP